jgi:hypothetical protein
MLRLKRQRLSLLRSHTFEWASNLTSGEYTITSSAAAAM